MNRMQTCVLLIGLFAAVPVATRAQCPAPSAYARFNVKTQDTYELCTSNVSGVVTVLVTVTTLPASKVRFSLPDPPFGIGISEYWEPHTGDRINGMEFDLGCTGPQSVQLYLGAITFFVTGSLPCTTWEVDADCEVEDCNGVPRLAESIHNTFSTGIECVYCFQQCKYFPPYNLDPPTGATNVSPDAALSFDWDLGPYADDPQSSVTASIAIGTDPNCADWQTVSVNRSTRSIVLDFLEPATTYYWSAIWGDQFTACSPYGARSEVHSFTTAGIVAVEATTWGRIKSMYRE